MVKEAVKEVVNGGMMQPLWGDSNNPTTSVIVIYYAEFVP